MIKLKNLAFPKFMSAPMDRITDSPMRQLIRHFSSDELLFTEMRHVSSVANHKNSSALKYDPIEQPLAFQISVNKTDFIDIAIEKIINNKFVMINLNAGCPAKNVIKSESGSALMANPKQLKKLMVTIKKEINGRVPFTLKIRSGFKEKNGLEIAKLAQDCGVEALIIHPRKQTGGFSEPLDFDLVKEIKKSLSIPVIFSGEIWNWEDAKTTYEKTGVDGFMIGRALWGAPWKLKEILCESKGEKFDMNFQKIIRIAIKHLDLSCQFYGANGTKMFKRHLGHYVKGLPGAATLRRELLSITEYKDLKEELETIKKFVG